MKTFFAALALATLIGGSAFVTSADAARRSVPEYDQPRARRDSDGSWQCYPYCAGGTYEGRPVASGSSRMAGESRESSPKCAFEFAAYQRLDEQPIRFQLASAWGQEDETTLDDQRISQPPD